MGRAKLKMELIAKEKSRNTTFKKRKEGLIRKMHEFTTLCDVSACMIIYAPKQDGVAARPEIWPQDDEEVRRVIDIYKSKKKDSGSKIFGLSDFFHDRKRKIEEDLVKLRRKNMETKYPTWSEQMDFLTQPELRELVARLSNKAVQVKSRIEDLKFRTNFIDFGHATTNLLSQPPNQFSNIPYHHYPIDLNNNQEMLNQNLMLSLMMNDNDHNVQYGGSLPGESIHSASSGGQVTYDWTNMRTTQQYFPPMHPTMMPPQFMPYSMMQGMTPTFYTENHQGDGGQEEVLPYKNSTIRFEDLIN